jgi:hypothetical protein
MSATEVERSRPVCVLGWQTADRLFGSDVDPLDKVIQIEGVHFRVVGVSSKRGAFLGNSQDEFAVVPLGQFQMIFGSRRSLQIMVRPRDAEGTYVLVFGERRTRASRLAGKTTIPALIQKTMDDATAKRLTLKENEDREDLHPLERAKAVAYLLEDGLTLDQVAYELGKSRKVVARRNAGRAFLYAPAAPREAMRRLARRQFLDAWFDGSERDLLEFLNGAPATKAAAPSPRIEPQLDAALL